MGLSHHAACFQEQGSKARETLRVCLNLQGGMSCILSSCTVALAASISRAVAHERHSGSAHSLGGEDLWHLLDDSHTDCHLLALQPGKEASLGACAFGTRALRQWIPAPALSRAALRPLVSDALHRAGGILIACRSAGFTFQGFLPVPAAWPRAVAEGPRPSPCCSCSQGCSVYPR